MKKFKVYSDEDYLGLTSNVPELISEYIKGVMKDTEINEFKFAIEQDLTQLALTDAIEWCCDHPEKRKPIDRHIALYTNLVILNVYWNEHVKNTGTYWYPVFNETMDVHCTTCSASKRDPIIRFLKFNSSKECVEFCKKYKDLLVEYDNIIRG